MEWNPRCLLPWWLPGARPKHPYLIYVRTYASTYETKDILNMPGCGGLAIKIQGDQIIVLTLPRMTNIQ